MHPKNMSTNMSSSICSLNRSEVEDSSTAEQPGLFYFYHRIGWWDNLQESPTNLMVLVKTMVSCRFSQQNQSIDFNMSGFFQRATSLTGRGDLATFAAPWWAEGARAGRNSNLINWSKANSHWNWNLAFFFIPNQFSKKYPRMYPRMHQKVI